MDDDSTVTGERSEFGSGESPLLKTFEARLLVLKGEEKGRSIKLTTGINILGRTEGTVLIPDPKVSRKHAVLEVLGPEVFYLKDLASSNGTLVNDKEVTLTRLSNGDTIVLGDTVLKFYISRSA